MDMYGYLMSRDSGHIIITATGCTQTMAGPGCQIITGDGRPSITAAGSMMMLMDGCGYRVMSGLRPGFRGEMGVVVTDGLH